MDTISESRLQAVNPELARRIGLLADLLSAQGITIRVTQGLRTWAEQEQLYEQGRSLPGKIVTNAKAGYSWHNFGLAVDVAPFVDGVPDWDVNHPDWKTIISIGTELGLVSGSTFVHCPDNPHFQLTGAFPETPTDEVRSMFAAGNDILAIWSAANIEPLPDDSGPKAISA